MLSSSWGRVARLTTRLATTTVRLSLSCAWKQMVKYYQSESSERTILTVTVTANGER